MSESGNRLASGILRLLFITLLGVSMVACGGGSSNDGGTTPPPGNNGGNNNDDDDDDDDDDNGDNVDDGDDTPNGSVKSQGELAPRDPVVIVFDMSMDPASLELDGSLAKAANTEWSSAEHDNDTVTLTPGNYWAPGAKQLSIDASSAAGIAMETVNAEFNVRQPFTNFQPASIAIGQPDLESGAARQGLEHAAPYTLELPIGSVAFSQEKNLLFVPDSGDSRILAFNGIPTESNEYAEFVIGQENLWSSTGGTSAGSMISPQGVSAEGGHLIVADPENHRVLVWNDVPETGPVDASVVIGQQTLDDNERAQPCHASSLRHSHGHFVTPSGRLLVADSDNNRVLVWNEMPTENAQAPDLVIGQSDFDLCAPNDEDQDGFRVDEDYPPTAYVMHHPSKVWTDDEVLIIADQYNHRILIWNEFPTENYTSADIVLGQASMDMMAANDDDQDGEADAAPSARTLNNPWTVWVEQGQLFVTDTDNNRVLAWNEIPQESFAPADVVLGQPDFTSNAANAGEAFPNAHGLDLPYGLRVIGDRLFVTDRNNSRVVVYDIQD